jgi:hypothetical protein
VDGALEPDAVDVRRRPGQLCRRARAVERVRDGPAELPRDDAGRLAARAGGRPGVRDGAGPVVGPALGALRVPHRVSLGDPARSRRMTDGLPVERVHGGRAGAGPIPLGERRAHIADRTFVPHALAHRHRLTRRTRRRIRDAQVERPVRGAGHPPEPARDRAGRAADGARAAVGAAVRRGEPRVRRLRDRPVQGGVRERDDGRGGARVRARRVGHGQHALVSAPPRALTAANAADMARGGFVPDEPEGRGDGLLGSGSEGQARKGPARDRRERFRELGDCDVEVFADLRWRQPFVPSGHSKCRSTLSRYVSSLREERRRPANDGRAQERGADLIKQELGLA